MKSIEIPGRIDEKGGLFISHQTAVSKWITTNKGKEIRLTIETRTKTRSNPQNRYYWGICIPMIRTAINELGNEFTKQETHEFLKSRFNYKEVEILDGQYIDIPESTKKLDTVGFMDYIARIQRFALEMLNIDIPDPEKDIQN